MIFNPEAESRDWSPFFERKFRERARRRLKLIAARIIRIMAGFSAILNA